MDDPILFFNYRLLDFKNANDAASSCVICMSESISRVLSLTVIYLGAPLPTCSSHLPGTAGPASCPSAVLLRIEFTSPNCLQPARALLPHVSTLTSCEAVSLCCTCPRVTPGGRYPLSLPYGARTFLTHSFSACARDCPTRSNAYCNHLFAVRQGFLPQILRLVRLQTEMDSGIIKYHKKCKELRHGLLFLP